MGNNEFKDQGLGPQLEIKLYLFIRSQTSDKGRPPLMAQSSSLIRAVMF